MKRIYLTFIILMNITLYSQSISFDIQPSNQSISVGENATYEISVTSYDNFNQQINFTVIEHSLNISNVIFNFTPQYIDYPYNQSISFEISTNGSIGTGNYYIIIEGGNGPTTNIDTCYLTITNDSCVWVNHNLTSSYSLEQIVVDKNDIPWVTTSENELLKYENSSWSTVEFIDQNFISNIIVDTNNNKWVASNNGLLKYNDTTWTIFNTLLSEELHSIAVDTLNNIWIGTYDIGLLKFDGTYWTVYDTNNTNLTSNYISKIKFDKEGNLWLIINQYSNNLSYFDGISFIDYNYSNSCLPNTDIYNVDFDNENSIWIATQNGLIKYDGQKWEKWFVSSQNNNHQIFDNNCTLISQDNTSNLTYEACNYIYIDNDNNKWISNRDIISEPPGVVIKFNNNNWYFFIPDNSTIPDNTAYCISQSENSNLWFVTLQNSTYGEFSISEYDCSNQYTSINENDNLKNYFKVYPNPFDNNLSIEFERLNNNSITIEIINSLGTIVYKETNVNGCFRDIKTSNISSGVYILRISTYNNIYTSKIIKK